MFTLLPLAAFLGIALAPPIAVAPSPAELEAAFVDADAALDEAEAIGRAVARTHNAWAERLAAGEKPTCEDARFAALPERARQLLVAHRDAAQSAHVRAQRLRRMASAGTLAAVMDEARTERVEKAMERARAQRSWYLEAMAWQRRYLARPPASCTTSLYKAEGFGAPVAENEWVAILATGDGWVCPARVPASSGVIVLQGEACYGDGDCGCTPEPVLPGVVLGP